MNNPKLTNVLLIALVVLNVLFLIGAHIHSHHRHQQFGNRGFREERSIGWAFHQGFKNHRRCMNCCNYDNRMSREN